MPEGFSHYLAFVAIVAGLLSLSWFLRFRSRGPRAIAMAIATGAIAGVALAERAAWTPGRNAFLALCIGAFLVDAWMRLRTPRSQP